MGEPSYTGSRISLQSGKSPPLPCVKLEGIRTGSGLGKSTVNHSVWLIVCVCVCAFAEAVEDV